MANESLRANVAQEVARRRVTDELMPRQSRLNALYGPPEIPIPAQVTPYQTFEQPSDNVKGLFDPGMGSAPDSVDSPADDAAPSSGLSAAVANASAISNAVNSPIGIALAAIAPLGVPVAMALNAQANNTLNEALAQMAIDESQVSLAEFGPDSSSNGVGPGPDSATDASSVGAVNGADSASDAAAAAAAAATGDAGDGDGGDGGGGGGGGSGGKIVCTAMNKAYGFGAYRQAIWLDYSAKRLTKQHERGYHRIFRPLVRYAFHSGNSLAKRNVRQFLEYIMRLRTADLRAEMRGKNPHPVRRVIRRTCEYICYLAGKP